MKDLQEKGEIGIVFLDFMRSFLFLNECMVVKNVT